jgi:hypothetical protein
MQNEKRPKIAPFTSHPCLQAGVRGSNYLSPHHTIQMVSHTLPCKIIEEFEKCESLLSVKVLLEKKY